MAIILHGAISPMNNPRELPFADAARLLSPVATERTLRTYRERGLLRAVKIGRIWHTTPEAIEELRALLWQNSSSTGQTQSTGPSRERGKKSWLRHECNSQRMRRECQQTPQMPQLRRNVA